MGQGCSRKAATGMGISLQPRFADDKRSSNSSIRLLVGMFPSAIEILLQQRSVRCAKNDSIHCQYRQQTKQAGAKWLDSPYVRDNVNCLHNPDDLDYCGIEHGTSEYYATELLMLAWQNLWWRCWSFSKHKAVQVQPASPDQNEAEQTCQRQ